MIIKVYVYNAAVNSTISTKTLHFLRNQEKRTKIWFKNAAHAADIRRQILMIILDIVVQLAPISTF